MRYMLFVLGVLVATLGLFTLLLAKTSIHEILAGILLLMAAVLISGGVVASAVSQVRDELRKHRPPPERD
jgi:uncharacterized membrane protein